MRFVLLALTFSALLARADELSDTFDKLKAAERAQNGADVNKYATETSRLARIQLAKPASPEMAQSDYGKERLVYLSQTDTYTEYSMGVAASYPSNSPETVIKLTESIVTQNPKSDYLELAVPPYLSALLKTSQQAELDGANRILKLQPENEDARLRLTEGLLAQQKLIEAGQSAAELLAVMSEKPRPDRYSVELWRDKKTLLINRSHFVAGAAACEREAWRECDAHLRTVNDPANAGPTAFYLGLANYRLANLDDALKFSRQSAAIAGPMQTAASRNAAAIEAEQKKTKK